MLNSYNFVDLLIVVLVVVFVVAFFKTPSKIFSAKRGHGDSGTQALSWV